MAFKSTGGGSFSNLNSRCRASLGQLLVETENGPILLGTNGSVDADLAKRNPIVVARKARLTILGALNGL
jgi:hypothetical protein